MVFKREPHAGVIDAVTVDMLIGLIWYIVHGVAVNAVAYHAGVTTVAQGRLFSLTFMANSATFGRDPLRGYMTAGALHVQLGVSRP